MYVVYGLEDPRDNLYHYVGITDDVYKRFNDHLTGSGGNIKKNGWIFECRQSNVMIIMRELQRVELLECALERERYWVKHYMDLGHPLQNMQIARSIIQEQVHLEQLAKKQQEKRDREIQSMAELVAKMQAQMRNPTAKMDPDVEQYIDVKVNAMDARAVRIRTLVKDKIPPSKIIEEIWGISSKTGGDAYRKAARELTDIMADLV